MIVPGSSPIKSASIRKAVQATSARRLTGELFFIGAVAGGLTIAKPRADYLGLLAKLKLHHVGDRVESLANRH